MLCNRLKYDFNMLKIARNQQCLCGSNLKYKKCCLKNQLEEYAWSFNFYEKVKRGEIHPTAQVIGNGAMQIGKTVLSVDGKETTYLNENIEIRSKSLDGTGASGTSQNLV